LDHVEGFEPRAEGSFLAYLRSILMNQVRNEIRRVGSRPARVELSEAVPSKAPSPLEGVLSQERLETYEAALAALPERAREAVILRLEFECSYREIAAAICSPSANATRMLISRALVTMMEAMHGSR
jgi:RNA polymerase sigma-70 factor (ECF subfamily)